MTWSCQHYWQNLCTYAIGRKFICTAMTVKFFLQTSIAFRSLKWAELDIESLSGPDEFDRLECCNQQEMMSIYFLNKTKLVFFTTIIPPFCSSLLSIFLPPNICKSIQCWAGTPGATHSNPEKSSPHISEMQIWQTIVAIDAILCLFYFS